MPANKQGLIWSDFLLEIRERSFQLRRPRAKNHQLGFFRKSYQPDLTRPKCGRQTADGRHGRSGANSHQKVAARKVILHGRFPLWRSITKNAVLILSLRSYSVVTRKRTSSQ